MSADLCDLVTTETAIGEILRLNQSVSYADAEARLAEKLHPARLAPLTESTHEKADTIQKNTNYS